MYSVTVEYFVAAGRGAVVRGKGVGRLVGVGTDALAPTPSADFIHANFAFKVSSDSQLFPSRF